MIIKRSLKPQTSLIVIDRSKRFDSKKQKDRFIIKIPSKKVSKIKIIE